MSDQWISSLDIVVCMGGTMMVGDGGDPWSGGGSEQVGPEQFTRFLRHRQGLDFVNSMQSPVLCTDATCCCFLL